MPEPLPPISKFELNRMAHARAQEVHLPGSLPGTSGHKHLSQAAMIHFGKRSWSELGVDEMKAVYDYLDQHRKMPRKGDI